MLVEGQGRRSQIQAGARSDEVRRVTYKWYKGSCGTFLVEVKPGEGNLLMSLGRSFR